MYGSWIRCVGKEGGDSNPLEGKGIYLERMPRWVFSVSRQDRDAKKGVVKGVR